MLREGARISSAVVKLRDLFRRTPLTDEQRGRRELARQAESELLDKKLRLRGSALGIPPWPDGEEEETPSSEP
jgi:hypothetical protein